MGLVSSSARLSWSKSGINLSGQVPVERRAGQIEGGRAGRRELAAGVQPPRPSPNQESGFPAKELRSHGAFCLGQCAAGRGERLSPRKPSRAGSGLPACWGSWPGWGYAPPKTGMSQGGWGGEGPMCIFTGREASFCECLLGVGWEAGKFCE